MDAAAFSKAFTTANANRQFIAGQMADIIRDVMRAVSSENGSIHRISEKMDLIGELLTECSERLTWWDIFSDAIEEFRENVPSEFESSNVHAAMRGIKFIVESSATDSGAPGRTGRRENEFQSAMKHALLPRNLDV